MTGKPPCVSVCVCVCHTCGPTLSITRRLNAANELVPGLMVMTSHPNLYFVTTEADYTDSVAVVTVAMCPFITCNKCRV